jgi:peptide/nickel transport system permease protein
MAGYQHKTLWQRIRKNKLAFGAMVFLVFLLALALLAPYIANHKPLYAVYKGQTMFPAFTQQAKYSFTDATTNQLIELDVEETDWKQLDLQAVVWPLIPYSPGRSDLMNANYHSPGSKQEFRTANGTITSLPTRYRHWLGTGVRGDDVLAGLIHGARISLYVGLFSMFIASLLGIALGALSGYFGNNGLRVKRAALWGFYLALLPAWFYGFYLRAATLADALNNSIAQFTLHLLYSLAIFALVCSIIILLLTYTIGRLKFFKKPVSVPVDTWVTRCIETIISIPGIILIIAIAAITQKLLGVIIVVIGLTGWTGIARLIRAEMLRIRQLDYIAAAQAAGLKRIRIIFIHALPNAIQPALVSMVFGVASAILIESGLSFLGAFPVSYVTWGGLLAEGRNNFNAWWLVIFPGMAVFLTVTALNLLGDALRDELDVKDN